MDRRTFLTTASSGTAGLWFTENLQANTKQRPNILLVIGDDMHWRDCEPYGNHEVLTPNITRLARQGMCFDSMFTSTAMCAPTRQQLYTGLYPVRNGAYPNHSRVYEGVKSIVHHLKAMGYRCGLSGKKHFHPPQSFPFEMLKSQKPADADAMAEFIHRDKNQPYFLIVASHEPHKAWNKGDASRYNADALTVPPFLIDCKATRDELTKYYPEISYLDGELGACMQAIEQSGRQDNTITIFTSEQGVQMPFGKWTCYDHGLKTAFIVRWPGVVKPGTRCNAMTQYVDVVPTLIEAAGGDPSNYNPGRPDAHGKKGFDGRSFLSQLKGEKNPHRDFVYGVQTTRGIINGSACYPVRSVRSRRYKYICNLNHASPFYNIPTTRDNTLYHAWEKEAKRNPAIAERVRMYKFRPPEELYDMENDPNELKNLIDDPSLAEIKQSLKQELKKWMQQQGDEGIPTELRATERQGRNGRPNWNPYNPAKAKK